MKFYKRKFKYAFLLSLACLLIFSCVLEAATLSVGSASGSPGDEGILITVDLSSSAGEEAGGFAFDLTFDIARLSFKEVALGPKAQEAEKTRDYSQPDPDVVRVMVTGYNENIINDGTVLNFTFDILNNAPSGEAELIFTAPFMIFDPMGNLLPATTENGKIIVEEDSVETTSTTSSAVPSTVPTTTPTTSPATIPTTTPATSLPPTTTTEPTITSTSIQPPPDTTTTVKTSVTTTVKTTSSINSTSSSTTTSTSQLWPLLYEEMWNEKKDLNLFFLRSFRDEVLLNTEVGREYVFMLYNNSLEIAILLFLDPLAIKHASRVADQFLISIESLLYEGELAISQKAIDDFMSLLSQFEINASPKLKTFIRRAKKDMKEESVLKQLGITIVDDFVKSPPAELHFIATTKGTKEHEEKE